MADFKQLRGNRLLLNLPKKEEGKLIVDENTKEALEKEMMQKLNKLSVLASAPVKFAESKLML
jgi:hypothetical protein